jgi:LPXTG-motif cell wall-anchored protein
VQCASGLGPERRSRSAEWLKYIAVVTTLLALVVLATSCDSGSSKSASNPKSHPTTTTSPPAKNASAVPTGAEAAVAAYVKGLGYDYAGDCASAKLPQDKGKWCSTLVSGDDKSDTQTYDVGPVGEKPQKRITIKRRGAAQLTPGFQVGVAEGNVGQPQELTHDQLLGDVWITGNLLLDQIAGIGNGLADLPAGAPTTGGGAGNGGPPPPTTTAPPTVVGGPTTGPAQYPIVGGIEVENPNVTPGAEVAFRGSGCAANEQLSVLFDGVQIGTLLSDAGGNFAGSIKVPVGTPPGQHVLTVKGAFCALNVTITVAGNLPFTGASSHTTTYVLAGLAAVVVGVILVVGSRRRRRVIGRRGMPPRSHA